MAQSSNPPLVKPVAIINPQFCAPHTVDLTIDNGEATATDVNGKVMRKFFIPKGRHIVLDGAKNPFLTLQHKTEHRCCQVFLGDSKDLLFSVEKSTHDVFLAGSYVCDFKIEGEWVDHSCIISRVHGNSAKIIAEKHEKNIMTVYPNVDCAFIVALVVVLEEIDP